MRIMILLILAMQVGCYTTTLRSADFQPSVADETVEAGMSLSDVERIVGNGVPIVGLENGYAFRYEDTKAWSGRTWIFWLFDVSTIGMASWFTMPIELKIEADAQRWGTALFTPDDELVFFRVEDQEPLLAVGQTEEPMILERDDHYFGYLQKMLGEKR